MANNGALAGEPRIISPSNKVVDHSVCERCGQRSVGSVHYKKLPSGRVLDTVSFRCYHCDRLLLEDDRGKTCRERRCTAKDTNSLGLAYHYVLKTAECCGTVRPADEACWNCGSEANKRVRKPTPKKPVPAKTPKARAASKKTPSR